MAKSSKPKKKTTAKKKAADKAQALVKQQNERHRIKDPDIDPAVLNARLGVEAMTGQDITAWLEGRTVPPERKQYPEIKKEFTDKEKAFIWEYITNGHNKTQAANAAFDCVDLVCAASMGYEYFRKPHIKAEIDRLISDRLMSKEEVLQRMSQRARASLSDYLHTVKRMVRPFIKVSLNVLIQRTNDKIEDQQKFIERAGIKEGSERYKQLKELEQSYKEDIIKWVIELERNPGAYVEEMGDEVTEETIEIDMIKLAQDKERGIIKSFKRDKSGEIVIELCDADGMLRDVARYHGVFEKDNRRLNLNTVPLTAEEAKTINEALDKEY